MAEGNSGGWVGQLIGAIAIALVAGGSSPWWWSELKRAWQPDAPPAASSPVAPASAAAPVAPVSVASTASAPTVGVPALAPAPAPRSEPAAIRPRPDVTDQTSQRPATIAPAPRATPVAPAARAAPVSPAVAPASGPPATAEPNPDAYRAVQRIYERTKGVSDCAALADSVRNLQRYTRGQRLVPEEFRQTVIYPKRMAQPTIADLAMDRIARIKLASPNCFP